MAIKRTPTQEEARLSEQIFKLAKRVGALDPDDPQRGKLRAELYYLTASG